MTATTVPSTLRRSLDTLERAFVVGLYIFLLWRFTAAASHNPLNLIFLISEGLVMLLVLCRRSTEQISALPRDWAVAFAGTFASMMIMPGAAVTNAAGIAQVCLFFGIAVSVLAKLQLRRSFGIVPANRGLKTSGIYGLVRHPMYLGYFFVQGGTLLINFNAWNVVVLTIWAGLQLLRVHAEERVLARDPAYTRHVERVGYRLVPYIY